MSASPSLGSTNPASTSVLKTPKVSSTQVTGTPDESIHRRIQQKVYVSSSAMPELEAYCQSLSSAGGKKNAYQYKSEAIESFYDNVAAAYIEFIEQTRETENWEAAKKGRGVLCRYSKSSNLRQIIPGQISPNADFPSLLLDRYQKRLDIKIPWGTPMQPELLRKEYAYFRSLERFLYGLVDKGDLKEYQKKFSGAVFANIYDHYRLLLLKHLVNSATVEYDICMKEAKDLVAEFSLTVPSPEMSLDDIPNVFESEFKVFDGPVMLASDPSRPVNNDTGFHCFAISVLQALVTFYPTIASSVTVDMSAVSEASSFVH